jgi:hypothetical protein
MIEYTDGERAPEWCGHICPDYGHCHRNCALSKDELRALVQDEDHWEAALCLGVKYLNDGVGKPRPLPGDHPFVAELELICDVAHRRNWWMYDSFCHFMQVQLGYLRPRYFMRDGQLYERDRVVQLIQRVRYRLQMEPLPDCEPGRWFG